MAIAKYILNSEKDYIELLNRLDKAWKHIIKECEPKTYPCTAVIKYKYCSAIITEIKDYQPVRAKL